MAKLPIALPLRTMQDTALLLNNVPTTRHVAPHLMSVDVLVLPVTEYTAFFVRNFEDKPKKIPLEAEEAEEEEEEEEGEDVKEEEDAREAKAGTE